MISFKHSSTAVVAAAIFLVGGWFTPDRAPGQPTVMAPTVACTVPGTHETIQEAVDDLACSSVGLTADDYFETVAIARSLTLTGAPSTLHGELSITGEGTAVEINGLAIRIPTDTTTPELVDLSFLPTSVDVTAAPQDVTVTMSVTDDISGTNLVSAQFLGPSGVQTLLTNLSLVSGDPLNGVYEGTVTVLPTNEPGTWTLSQVQVSDASGNLRSYSTADLQTLGFPVELEVILNDCTMDSYEPDNDAASASPITAGGTQTHSLCPENDEDWVRFDLDIHSAIAIETSGVYGNTQLWLYDSDLVELDFDDDSGPGFFSRIDRICDLMQLAPGTYYARVAEFGADDPIASYSISFTQTPCLGSEEVIFMDDFESGSFGEWSTP